MKQYLKILFAVSALFVAQSALACEYPTKTEVPNGSTASKDEMLAGQKAVKAFVAEMETYLDCLVEEERVARSNMDDLEPEDEQARDEMLNKKYNAAVGEMEKVAAEFNEEVQAYKARQE